MGQTTAPPQHHAQNYDSYHKFGQQLFLKKLGAPKKDFRRLLTALAAHAKLCELDKFLLCKSLAMRSEFNAKAWPGEAATKPERVQTQGDASTRTPKLETNAGAVVWGAHASGVWFSASRRKYRCTIISPPQFFWWVESSGATPELARGTRALPFPFRNSGLKLRSSRGNEAQTKGDMEPPYVGCHGFETGPDACRFYFGSASASKCCSSGNNWLLLRAIWR